MSAKRARNAAAKRRFAAAAVVCAIGLSTLAGSLSATPGTADNAKSAVSAAPQWFKGNLHTHSLWSDGDEYPEVIAEWYKQHGYHFLAISDHNVIQQGQRWFVPTTAPADHGYGRGGGGEVLERYVARFGVGWVEIREREGGTEVRLKPLDEYRALLEEPGRFLLMQSEEISANWRRPAKETGLAMRGPIHLNATNLPEFVEPVEGSDAVETIQRNVDAILEVRNRTGQAVLPHINHPNFKWAITAEELMRVQGAPFFEVYNGHAGVNNAGDASHLGLDQMWDVVLTRRLAELGLGVMFAVATDDAHNYQQIGPGFHNTGRGWVMVRARHLTPESLISAMESGDFYASTGVTLRDVRIVKDIISVDIESEPGVTYTIQFIGTRAGYDPSSEEIRRNPDDPSNENSLPHRRYSRDFGAVLAEVSGTSATYTLRGDEIYVRAKIISSKQKGNGSVQGEFEVAWTQPLVNPNPRHR